MWNRDNFVFLLSQLLLIKKVKVGEGGVGCLFNIMAYGGQLFWGSVCRCVTYTNEIQKDYFFFLILEMVTFAKPTNQMCLK